MHRSYQNKKGSKGRCVEVTRDTREFRWQIMPWCVDFTVDECGRAEPTRDKNVIGMYRRRGFSPPLLYDPGWVV